MNLFGVIGGLMLASAGLIGVLAVHARTNAGSNALAFLTDSDFDSAGGQGGQPIDAADPLDPVVERLLRPMLRRLTRRIRALYPSTNLDRIHDQLLHAGLTSTLRAEEFVTVQILVAALGGVIGLVFALFGPGATGLRLLVSITLIVMSVMAPRSWLRGKVDARTKQIERDLPDVLDLLTISVEAGLGLEAAMETACSDLASPMSEELARTLQEMSLGLSRHQALDNLKIRTNAQDLKTFVLVLSQADVLGMPIGRVLRTQADEMRDRRRARARERAAKLPVKILFPLMLFILPALMIVVLGPAIMGIVNLFSSLK